MKKIPIQADDIRRFQFVSDPQISPDGTRVLFTNRRVSEKNKYSSNLFMAASDGSSVEAWTQGEGEVSQGRWAPGGRQIAFVAKREGRSSQIYTISTEGGEARQASSLPEGSIGAIKWSPDGKRIAFTFRPQPEDWTETAKKSRKETGASEPPRITETGWYRLDGDGYFCGVKFGIYVLEIASGAHQLLCDRSPMGIYGFDWSADSQSLISCYSLRAGPWTKNSGEHLFKIGLDGRCQLIEGIAMGFKAAVAVSPDGKRIAYLGCDQDDDYWHANNSRVYVCNADGSGARCLTETDDYCYTALGISDMRDAAASSTLLWAPDSSGVHVSVAWHGETRPGFVDLQTGAVRIMGDTRATVISGNLSVDGKRLACLLDAPCSPAEIACMEVPSGATQVITSFNQELVESRDLVCPEEVWIEASDGSRVQAWVMRPTGQGGRQPAILEIHGGPHAQYGWAFFHEFQLLVSQGYVVVFSNPRGSKGYGEAHTRAIAVSWGEKDWTDIQAVISWMKRQPYIDSARMGVMGGSYGGYMTNWAVSHTREFRAAITDRSVSNIVTQALTNDYIRREGSMGAGMPFGSLEKIAGFWKQSPMAYFDQVETPMLIIHSEGDLRCNIEQADQVFAALQHLGVPARLVRYPASTFHGMSRSGPADLRVHRLQEILSWWKKYLE